jgi:predicted dehydrogenase
MTMRVAVAGLGWWGKQIIRCLKSSPRFEILYGVDPTPPADAAEFLKSAGVAYEADLDLALHDPKVEAVILATPHSLHEAQVLEVVAAGKNVFCEKPLTMTADGARRVLAATAKAGKVLGIGHERRYEPAFEELARIIHGGEIGRLLLLDANVSHDLFRSIDRSNWRLNSAHAPAGMMTAVGIHLTDLFVHFAGAPAEVRARTATMVFDPPAEDFVTAGIVFKSGVRASLTSLSATPFYGRFTAYGDQGWVEIVSEANVDKGKPTILTRNDRNGRRSVTYQANDTVLANFEAWADAVEKKKPYRFSVDELLQNIVLFEGIVTSARQGGIPVTF